MILTNVHSVISIMTIICKKNKVKINKVKKNKYFYFGWTILLWLNDYLLWLTRLYVSHCVRNIRRQHNRLIPSIMNAACSGLRIGTFILRSWSREMWGIVLTYSIICTLFWISSIWIFDWLDSGNVHIRSTNVLYISYKCAIHCPQVKQTIGMIILVLFAQNSSYSCKSVIESITELISATHQFRQLSMRIAKMISAIKSTRENGLHPLNTTEPICTLDGLRNQSTNAYKIMRILSTNSRKNW